MSFAVTMFTNLISRIHDRSQAEDILQAGVESVKQALSCDRVVVYSLQPQHLGKIVAESVAPGFPRTMETTIDDPCFNARYIDSYRQGRISAIDDVQLARITPCHLENLERLAVKANLVVPLRLPDDELYGLLILHQCSAPRVWKQEEITLSAQMSAQIGWGLANAVRWLECQTIQSSVDRQQHYNELLATATQKIHQGSTRAEVLQLATAQAQSSLTTDRAIVYAIAQPNLGKIIAESTLPALSPIVGMTIEDTRFESRYIEQYQQGRVQSIDNIHESGINSSSIDSLVNIAVKANLTVPIIGSQDELFGLLAVHQCFNYRTWQAMEIELLRQIGIQTGLALTKAQFQEEVAAMKSSLKRASMVKESIVTADTQMHQVKGALSNSVQTLEEAKHLLRLLSHEVNALTDKLSSEDINLVRIIAKKLQGNAETASTETSLLQFEIAELETVINSAIKVYKSRRSN
ncbi:GAF domain-containing protein [Chamaesiphon sp. VAR_48_metabat_135_sub]|uniref:GAF domain-containing protein n=1 Tax=Chamaesiphon sp. VAR_48_metabat_135_sub TaxID=2964699 RepID=UPI00286A58B9|nr:GAF domain-containing protein [Chamaesiphon sp. VAR_48_metabat_135_sub]